MDDLQLLRATRNTTGSVPPAVLAAGRERLMKKAAEAERGSLALVAAGSDAGFSDAASDAGGSGSGGTGESGGGRVLRPRRPWRRALVASAAAAAIVASVMTLDVAGSGDNPGATASAAEVLNAAAATTIEASDPVVGPGQYLMVDTQAVHAAWTYAADGERYVWRATQDHQLYIPQDRSGEWVWVREPSEPVEFFDEASREEAERQAVQREAEGQPQVTETWRADSGRWQEYGQEEPAQQMILGTIPLEEAIATAPRDPEQLLELIYDYHRAQGDGDTPYEEAFGNIADTLRTGLIPADLRAALYQAAALIPGLTIMDEQATLDGRTGVSLGMPTSWYEARKEIIIDPATGQMIGEREVLLEDLEGIPAGSPMGWSAVTTSVVDSAP